MPHRDQPAPPPDPQQIIDEQRREIERLREDLRRSEAERQRLRRENEKLKDELEAARRAVYRQAAPFSRGTRVAHPPRPGRKRGAAYGRRGHRPLPTHVDDIYTAPLPAACPHCHGRVRRVRVATQYQEELPVQRPLVRRFHVHIGQCTQCRRRVQGRHPLQTSDALGAAAVQLGPQAVAFAVLLNKRYGLPYGKIAALLRDRFGLRITRGGLVHAVHRAARQAQPTYDTLCATVRGSPVVTVDETSWRVDAELQWLWAWVTAGDDRLCHSAGPRPGASGARHRPRLCRRAAARRLAVVSLLYVGRASDVSRASAAPLSRPAARLSGASVCHRGEGRPAGRARHARRLPRRRACRRTDSRSPAGTTSSGSAACWRARPVAACRVRRFQRHLIVEFDAIFSFLFDPTLDATNWRAEHALRPAVVTRKMCGGGNRTRRGADSQQVLASVLRTAHQRGLDASDLLVTLLTAPTPVGPAEPRKRSLRYTDPLNTDLPTPNFQLPRILEPIG